MAAMNPTTCPNCGGRAHWNTDDGVTYCDEPKCDFQGVEDQRLGYEPPWHRGGSDFGGKR